jgi:hypothetical protein
MNDKGDFNDLTHCLSLEDLSLVGKDHTSSLFFHSLTHCYKSHQMGQHAIPSPDLPLAEGNIGGTAQGLGGCS